jgi:hypothetical protein
MIRHGCCFFGSLSIAFLVVFCTDRPINVPESVDSVFTGNYQTFWYFLLPGSKILHCDSRKCVPISRLQVQARIHMRWCVHLAPFLLSSPVSDGTKKVDLSFQLQIINVIFV